jgi:hypothetical protein
VNHQSPHHPGNSTLTAVRRRQARKGQRMNTWLKACIGASLLLVGYVGIAYADGLGEPPVTAQQQGPVPCEIIDQVLVCGSPVAVPTEEAPSKTPLYITELPSTGAGTTAQSNETGAHTGWHSVAYFCAPPWLKQQFRWADWVYTGSYYYHKWSIFPGYSTIVGYC